MKFNSNPLAEYPWILHESRLSALRALPNSSKSKALKGQGVFQARISGMDYRRAEALLLDGDDEPFQKVKTLLARGNLEQAKEEIGTLQVESIEAQSELTLEKARVAAFEAEWDNCAALCSKAMAENLPGVTRLTFLQVRALAYFELSLYSQALRDLEAMESMRTLYPHSPVLCYLRPLRIRLYSRMGQVERAQKLMLESWQESREGELSLDLLLTLLRTEIDLRLFVGGDARCLAKASLAIADALGDRLYAALARIDILRSGVCTPELNEALARDAFEYAKVRKSLEKISQTSQRTLSEGMGELGPYRTLFFSKQGLLIHLDPFFVFKMNPDERLTQVVAVLGRSPQNKETLFSEVWKISKYVPHRHENVIDQALSRIKKKYGLKWVRRDGAIGFERFLLI